MSISSLTNAAIGRRPDFEPVGAVPRTYAGIAQAAATPPTPVPGLRGVPPARDEEEEKAASPSAAAASAQNPISNALQVVVAYIPTEILTLYVAMMAVLRHPGQSQPQAGAPTQPGGFIGNGPLMAFWAFFIATPVVVWLLYAAKVKAASRPVPVKPAQWPLWEMFASTVSYAAWALAMPDCPFWSQPWYSSQMAGLAVLSASTVLGLLAPLFQRPIKL